MECELNCPYAECPYEGISKEQFKLSNEEDANCCEIFSAKAQKKRLYNKKYKEKNRDKIKEYNRRYRALHKEYYREYQKAYAPGYKDVKRLANREYYLKNRDKK